jgi:hypothetical protein
MPGAQKDTSEKDPEGLSDDAGSLEDVAASLLEKSQVMLELLAGTP